MKLLDTTINQNVINGCCIDSYKHSLHQCPNICVLENDTINCLSNCGFGLVLDEYGIFNRVEYNQIDIRSYEPDKETLEQFVDRYCGYTKTNPPPTPCSKYLLDRFEWFLNHPVEQDEPDVAEKLLERQENYIKSPYRQPRHNQRFHELMCKFWNEEKEKEKAKPAMRDAWYNK